MKVLSPYLNILGDIVTQKLLSPLIRQEIKIILDSFSPILDSIENEVKKLADNMGMEVPKNLDEIDEFIVNVLMISKSPTMESEILKNTEWDSFSESANNILYNIDEYHKHNYFLANFIETVLDNDLELLKNSYIELSEKRLKILSGDYRKTKKIIKSLYISDVDIQNDKIMDDLDELIICNDFRNVIRESKSVALSLFGSAWSNENTNPQSLHDISNWLLEFRGKLNEKKLSLETIDVICNGIDSKKFIMK